MQRHKRQGAWQQGSTRAGESATGKQDGGHWLASCDAVQIERWWARWPTALIGFPTGTRTGSIVIDLDPRDTPVADMLDALKIWCGGGLSWMDPETGEIICPAVAMTQSGGLHIYFAFAGDVKNRANLFAGFVKTGEALPALSHIDVRGEGGYVIAPPSVMDNGNAYHWIRRPMRGEAGGWVLPPLPPALRRVVTRERLPFVERPHAPRPASINTGHGLQRYLDKTIDGVLSRVRSAPEGERNQLIFWGACRLGEFVRGGVLASGDAEQMMLANLPSGVNPGEMKARKTILNGLANEDTPAFDVRKIERERVPA